MSETIHIVGFSGGIDSQACARWVLNRYPKESVLLVNSDAGGNEHPMTAAFIRQYSQEVHPVIEVSAQVQDMDGRAKGKIAEMGLKPTDPLTFDLLAKLKGRFPSTRAQFCTYHLKIVPQKRWIAENIDPTAEIIRYAGVRRDESRRRRNAPIESWDEYFDCPLIQPIARWKKQHCFDFVQAHGEPINPLYTLGFNRVGCAPCINSGKDDIRAWADRSPDMIDKIREWERSVGRTFFPPCIPRPEHRAAMKAWSERWQVQKGTDEKGEPFLVTLPDAPAKPMMPHNWVDEVVEWSRTTHGGRQVGLHVMYERPSCESKYGLCDRGGE